MVHGDWVEVAENDQKATVASLNYIHGLTMKHTFLTEIRIRLEPGNSAKI